MWHCDTSLPSLMHRTLVRTVHSSSMHWYAALPRVPYAFTVLAPMLIVSPLMQAIDAGLEAAHVPYSYGFAIIALTLMVKLATFPLTQKQASTLIAGRGPAGGGRQGGAGREGAGMRAGSDEGPPYMCGGWHHTASLPLRQHSTLAGFSE